jgi:hypothetical protein
MGGQYQRRSGLGKIKIVTPEGNQTQIIHPIASHFIDELCNSNIPNNVFEFNSILYLFTYLLNIQEINYKVNMINVRKKQTTKQKQRQKKSTCMI